MKLSLLFWTVLGVILYKCLFSYFLYLSYFAPAVTQAHAEKKLTGDMRNEFTQDICSSIRIHTMYPTKAEREQVAFLLIRKYPFLADAIGTGIVSYSS